MDMDAAMDRFETETMVGTKVAFYAFHEEEVGSAITKLPGGAPWLAVVEQVGGFQNFHIKNASS